MTIQIIKKVEEGYFLDEVINSFFSRYTLSDAQKSLIYEISSGVIRWKGFLNWVVSRLVKKNVKQEIRYLLWASVYQISFMKKGDYHIVNETVDYAKKEYGTYVAGFINAVLRKFIRESDEFSKMRDSRCEIRDLPLAYSFPEWLTKRWLERYGKENAVRLFEFLNKTPEFSIRVDINRMSRDEAAEELEAKGIRTRKGPYSEYALYVDRLMPVFKTTLFKKGLIRIQDEASQLVGLSIQPEKGDIILDACAGLGTKTLHIQERSHDAFVFAMDNEFKRLQSISRDTDRLLGDALHNPFKKESIDIVLIDAPCSSLGIIRKHPEIKWRRHEKDIIDFGNYQLELLDSLWDNLKTNGHMVYSVCSFEPEETLQVIERFKNKRAFVLENPLPFLFNKEYFLSLPYETEMDGFFIARLKKI
ncbi:MAG: 16S rRNA (cytosine(967)-C(5))-methyltransferase RsmB [Proteobacteria bacterium]|nr:16S rRNA (cytosine(967)-C(5))-methyltransferase RsmB [Pseudomonadota bacterium]